MDFDLREYQLAEYRILKDVADFCDRNGIVYFLDSGTLLGAARHKGFIPWDDDIDICMDVKNYRKFMKLARGLPEKYFYQNYRTDPKVAIIWSKVRQNGTAAIDAPLTGLDVHYGVGIDVFAIAGVAETKLGRAIQSFAGRTMNALLYKYKGRITGKRVSPLLTAANRILPDGIRLFFARCLERLVLLDTQKKTMAFNNFYVDVNAPDTRVFPSAVMDAAGRVLLPFEDAAFSCPAMYDEMLTAYFGDWRTPPPEGERADHGDLIVDLHRSYREYYTGG